MLTNIRYYINNRWISRSHALTAHKRDIKRGEWCDVGYRFLPCLFNELVDFVEVESAWHHVMWDKEARLKYKTPWWRLHVLRLRTWRCPEAGIAHLEWATALTNEEWISEGETPEPTRQALAAREILELYRWFTETYRNRPDPHDAGGWSEYCDRHREKHGEEFFFLDTHTEEDTAETKVILDRVGEIEEAYEKEDTEMMIRLIKVRGDLWT